MLLNAFVLACRQIWRNRLRSLLTVLGIVIGVASVIIMVTVGNGATQSVKEQIESLGSNQLMLRPGQRMGAGRAASAPAFKHEDIEAIARQVAGVTHVAPQRMKSVAAVAQGRNWSTQLIGSSNEFFTIDNRELAAGRFFDETELASGSAVCVIGETIHREIFGSSGAIGQMLRVGTFSCRVVGLMQEKGQSSMGGDQDDVVLIPIETFLRRVAGNTRISAILLSVDPSYDRAVLTHSLTQLMRERRSLSQGEADNFTILDTAEIAKKVSSTTKTLTGLLGAVAAVSLIVGGIGIMNIMLVSVTERTREIGIRLAIGALAREVLLQFLVEALVLGCLGGAVGVVLAWIISWAITSAMAVPFVWDATVNLTAFGFAALTGVVFGYVPARRAAALDPIEALRYE